MTFSAAGSQTAVSYPTPFSTHTPAIISTSTVTPTTTATPTLMTTSTFAIETNPRTVEANVWTSQGLEGQTIYSLAIDPKTPTTLYAGIYGDGGGVFKTTDGGENWNGQHRAKSVILDLGMTGNRHPYVGQGTEVCSKAQTAVRTGVPPTQA